MKYKIGKVSQKFALDNGLNVTKVYVLTWVYGIFAAKNMVTGLFEDENGVRNEYTWIKYSSFIEDYPLFGITTKTLGRIMLELSRIGILKKHTERTPNGAFSYYAKGDKWNECFSHSPVVQDEKPTAHKKAMANSTAHQEAMAQHQMGNGLTSNGQTKDPVVSDPVVSYPLGYVTPYSPPEGDGAVPVPEQQVVQKEKTVKERKKELLAIIRSGSKEYEDYLRINLIDTMNRPDFTEWHTTEYPRADKTKTAKRIVEYYLSPEGRGVLSKAVSRSITGEIGWMARAKKGFEINLVNSSQY